MNAQKTTPLPAERELPLTTVGLLPPAAQEVQAFKQVYSAPDPHAVQQAASREHAPDREAEGALPRDLQQAHSKDMQPLADTQPAAAAPARREDEAARLVALGPLGAGISQLIRQPAPTRDEPPPRPVPRTLQTGEKRKQAMQPMADLVQQLLQRAASRPVSEMGIVPPAPNPLQLSLQLAVTGDSVVVKARTGLERDRHDEVRLALATLEQMLTHKLPPGVDVHVVLLA